MLTEAEVLTGRRERILRFIVKEYVAKGVPVASDTLAQSSGLQVSPATIRNEVVALEEAGYIHRPHISAGAVPLEKAYRYYVDSLPEEMGLTSEEQRLLRHQFAQLGLGLEEWLALAAVMLARLAHNLALVTYPKASSVRLKRVGLVGVQPSLALLVLVLYQARIKQAPLPLEVVDQGELDRIASRLTQLYQGLSSAEFRLPPQGLSLVERRVLEACFKLMREEEIEAYEVPLVEGVEELFGQPEFRWGEKVIEVVEIAQRRLRYVLPRLLPQGPVRVIIGSEGREEGLQDLSLVLASYGDPGRAQGVLGLLGPTRMPYDRSISAVRYLSALLNEALSHYYTN